MSLLIDGYNLLHASGVMPSGRGPNTLQRAREALLRFLAASLTEEERVRTTIVFDAREAPYNRPRTLEHEGITVHFAPREIDADTLIEELIRADTSPRSLTVVSSDHRIQNAARRRRATAVDSDVWRAELYRRRNAPTVDLNAPKPQGPFTTAEVEQWMKEFRFDEIEDVADLPEEPDATVPATKPTHAEPAAKTQPSQPRRTTRKKSSGRVKTDKPTSWINPFPPGYAEDITEDSD